MVQRDQWDTYWGPKKEIFLYRGADDATMTAAPVETCQSVAQRSPWGRIGSVLYTCNRLSIVRFATGLKRSMGHLLGAKNGIFLTRGRGRPTVYGGRASLILSIRGPEVSLGPPRVGTIHVRAPTSHTPPLQAFLADFSQQPAEE